MGRQIFASIPAVMKRGLTCTPSPTAENAPKCCFSAISVDAHPNMLFFSFFCGWTYIPVGGKCSIFGLCGRPRGGLIHCDFVTLMYFCFIICYLHYYVVCSRTLQRPTIILGSGAQTSVCIDVPKNTQRHPASPRSWDPFKQITQISRYCSARQ